MKKRVLGILLCAVMIAGLTACNGGTVEEVEKLPDVEEVESENVVSTTDGADDFRIGIVTGSFSQSEDDRRGAQDFLEKYGEDKVTLAIYPDNFTDEYDVTVQTIVGLSEDPKIKAIVVNQAVDGTTDAFRQIKETRPDIICIAGEAYEDIEDIASVADLVVNCDFVSRGYLMVRSAHELGCDTFVHISFERHLSYETVAREVAVMKAACEEFGMTFAQEEAPDPTTEVGVPGAQAYIEEHIEEWVNKYGQNAAYFCTNDAHTEPLIAGLMEYGGYFIEADLPSPVLGYPGALDIDFTDSTASPEEKLRIVEEAVVEHGGAGRFGTWTSSYGCTVSAGLAEHARNVILGESSINDIEDLAKAFAVFSPDAEWNGSTYIDVDTGIKANNIILIYQDTYIMGDPGRYMGTTKIQVPEQYFTIK